MEAAKDDFQKSANTESNRKMQVYRRRYLQSGKLTIRAISAMQYACIQLCAKSETARTKDKGPTRFGRSSIVLLTWRNLKFLLWCSAVYETRTYGATGGSASKPSLPYFKITGLGIHLIPNIPLLLSRFRFTANICLFFETYISRLTTKYTGLFTEESTAIFSHVTFH